MKSRSLVSVFAVTVVATALSVGCGGTPAKKNERAPTSEVDADNSSAVTSVSIKPSKAAARPPEFYIGSTQFVAKPVEKTPATAEQSSGIQLSFIDTEISTVISSVLGDGLSLSYTIDPGIKGTMTLQSSRALGKEELLSALEAALRVHDIVLVKTDDTYRVVPRANAARQVSTMQTSKIRGQPGFGIQIVPLQFVSVTEMQKMLEPFAPAGGVLRVDEARNLLLLAGSSQDLATMLEVVSMFDVDWLSGMSFAMFNLTYVDAQTLARELGEIFSGAKSPMAGLVRLVPVPRLNSILAISPQPKFLADVDVWIKRLDLSGGGPGRRIYVYDVQNGKAADLAASLNKILSLRSDERLGETSPSQSDGRAAQSQSQSLVTNPSDAASGDKSVLETGSLKIVPNDENNSLLILATPSEFGVIEQALQRLDLMPRQVLIEASLAEVTLTDDMKYGVQWSYLGGDGPLSLSESSGGVSQRFPGFSYLFTGRTDIRAVLNAIESVTSLKVISSPKLMVLNNREASLQIGDQVPIVTQSAVGTTAPDSPIVNTVQLRDTGVILHVTPRVNKSGLVSMDITQEVSDVVPTTTSGIDSPTIQQRKFTSTVVVKNGETIALGGLIRDRKSKSRSGVRISLVYRYWVPLSGQRMMWGVGLSSSC